MAGEAKTEAFVLSTATVMIGPMDSVFDLTPATHSIGLVKNFTVTAEPTYTDLTQGVKNNIVYSVLTNNPVRASMEVYEFTAKNLSYGLGLDGSALQSFEPLLLDAQLASAATAATAATGVDVSGDYLQDDWVIFQQVANPDTVHLAKLSGDSSYTTNLTLNFTGHAVPAGVSFEIGDKVSRVNRIDVGSKEEQPYFGAKVVGVLPDDNKPITLIFPKLRVTRGFSMAFTSENFGNMPFEFTPFELVASDTLYSEFSGRGVASLFSGS